MDTTPNIKFLEIEVSKQDIARFWSKVKVKDKYECWEWQARLDRNGYGITSIGELHYAAHRVAYAIWKGKVPKGRIVCHTCDNRRCVNPNHLFAGTHKMNTHDMIERGKHFHDGKNKERKLTKEEEEMILDMRRRIISQRQVAKIFGINVQKVMRLERKHRIIALPDSQET